ncbi:IPT/TIG domain-containing protein [Hymenobacter sp. J193]|uniref:DUF7619 domain-containing protein n=1 Tax=Hymenobacter sp. J193 TaxID=2898429 RepID=UPI002151B356|nr:IPT/TIG domain-containing protein [Hymenobacter sp. J193]MCR5887035.1 IPT/TIG domain-containing protein [Hymenobacter sp. J193]
MLKLLLGLWFFLLAIIAQAQVPSFTLQHSIGVPLNFPQDVAVDGEDNIYVLEFGQIIKLSPTGQYLRTIKTQNKTNTRGATSFGVDKYGNVYISSSEAAVDSIYKFSSEGKLITQYSADPDSKRYREVNLLTVDESGNAYLVDGNNLFQKVSSTGKLIYQHQLTKYPQHIVAGTVDKEGVFYAVCEDFSVFTLDSQGQVKTSFEFQNEIQDDIQHVLIDGHGMLYVSTLRYSRIEKFDQQGNHVGFLDQGNLHETKPAMALDSQGNFIVTSPSHGGGSKILKLSSEGAVLDEWGHTSSYGDVAVDEQGNFYCYNYTFTSGHLLKYSSKGEKLAEIGADQQQQNILSICLDVLGNLYTLSDYNANSSGSNYLIRKFDSQGKFVKDYTPPVIGHNLYTDLAVDAQGNLYLTDYYGGCVRKLNKQGVLVASIGTWGKGKGQVWIPEAVTVDLGGNVYVADYDGRRVQKFSPGGNLLRAYGPETIPEDSSPTQNCEVGLGVDAIGNLYVNGNRGEVGMRVYRPGSKDATLISMGTDRLAVNTRGTFLVAITRGSNIIDVYGNTNTTYLSNTIIGLVYQDKNSNCQQDTGELPLPNIVVKAGPYYGVSDQNGRYIVAVDTGRYIVQQITPQAEIGREIRPTCTVAQAVVLNQYLQTATGPSFGNKVTDSPSLSVQITANRRRRCFRNVTTVSYSNQGYAASAAAYVTVALPPQVVFISAGLPYEQNAAGQYVFSVGKLAPGQQGSIIIQDSVVCGDESLRGLTVCTKAWITPPNTYPTSSGSGAASLTVKGLALPDQQTRFVVRNVGKAATQDSLALRVFADTDLALRHHISLAAGDSVVLRVPATTAVVRVEADQPPGHPGSAIASATLEIPALRTVGRASAALAAFPPDNNSAEVKEDCQAIVDSFDPNDKLVIPAGISEQHYTPRNASLRYRIRFQNTGTDVAYQVKVIDTLATDLDISTLQLEGASHPYRYELQGKGQPTLSFTFDDIQLPDSAHHPAASQGFVQFSIRPKADLADKTLIENEADIFFDYNSPVRTNLTSNRIYDVPATVTAQSQVAYTEILATPQLLAISPFAGRAGSIVTLTGHRFAATTAGNQVKFNGNRATVVSADANKVQVRVPFGATSGSIQLQTPDGHTQSLEAFTVYQQPTLATVTPAEAVPGSTVLLTGTHFSEKAEQDTVLFNGIPATIMSASTSSLQVQVPYGAKSGKVVVKTLGGEIESKSAFNVWYPPTLSVDSFYKGKAGSIITLTGTNFSENSTRNTVTLGGVMAEVKMATPTALRVQVPANGQSGNVWIKTPGGQVTADNDFVFLPAPRPISFQPTEGIVGTEVTLSGFNYSIDEKLDTLLLNNEAIPVLQASANSLKFRIPRGASTGNFTVAGVGGRSIVSQPFKVTALSNQEAVVLYPNPSRGVVTVDWSKANFDIQSVRVYSAVGSLIASVQINSLSTDHTTFTWDDYKPGLYLVIIQSDNAQIVKRVLLQ